MKQENQHLFSRIKQLFALPQHMTFHSPKITVINNETCHIENHQGIVTFTDSQLIVKTKTGYMIVLGSSFVVTLMVQEELFLQGLINEVKFSKKL
ncbi:MAG TPA: YabP/YqfC family sporulation protein [Bacillota bacterium]|nr:YabP/YqfC family sporulation protein [Bacillota bacterium]